MTAFLPVHQPPARERQQQMTTTPPQGPRHPLRPRVLAGLLGAALAVGGGAGWAVSHASDTAAVAASASVPVPEPVVTPAGLRAGKVPWHRPLSLSVADGTLRQVTATDPDGNPLAGELTDASWTSSGSLLPGATYRLTATVVDRAGKARTLSLTQRTTPAAKTLHAVLSPGDAKVVGVGQPVIVTLDRPVNSAADRAAVVSRLSVSATPPVAGAWRWMSASELHYRGPGYWTKGQSITTKVDFTRLKLSEDVWGEGVRTSTYSIGSAVIATVDVQKKVMTVVRDGVLLRTVKVSTGRDQYPTKGGVHLVLEKVKLKTMDSSTIGIPRNSRAGYYLKVPHSVRISYSGEFVHSAPGTVRQQGVANVSHGCVNVAPADAAWFFALVKRGDVVDVKNAAAKPRLSDPGMSDWNVPFSSWAN
jgi:lipoprotein-anchoring transpeptidase ErfK/SrfK